MRKATNKLRELCRFASAKPNIVRYKQCIITVEVMIERDIAAGHIITSTTLGTLISAHIVDLIENRFQGATGRFSWYLSKADRKTAIDSLMAYFATKYNIVPTNKFRKIAR